MKKDETVYQFGEFIILAVPVDDGFIHVVNVNTSWQFRIYMGANANIFLTLPQEEIYNRLNSIYMLSTFSMYSSEYVKDVTEFSLEKLRRTTEAGERPRWVNELERQANDLETVKKDEYMKEILSKTDEEIMMEIASGEFKFNYFKDKDND